MDVVGKALRRTIRVNDPRHFTVRLTLQRRGLIQRIGHRHQVLAFVIAIPGAFARTVLETLDLDACVPPQVLGLVRRIDDGMRQAVLAIEVFGLVGEGICFSDSIVLVVIVGFPDAAVRILTLFLTSQARW